MVNETRSAIYRGFTFLLEIDGIVRAGFRECSGLDPSQDPIDYRVGVEPATARTLPGQAKPSVISLKHGITGDAELWEWRHNFDVHPCDTPFGRPPCLHIYHVSWLLEHDGVMMIFPDDLSVGLAAEGGVRR